MIGKIRLVYDDLSKSDKRIADYFVEHKKDIVNMNIQQVADEAGTSSASVSRFVQKVFGLSFADTKIELAMSMDVEEEISGQFEWHLDFEQIPGALLGGMRCVFDDILKINRLADLEEITEILAAADTIYLFGIGASGIVAQDMAQKLIKLGKRTIYTHDSNLGTINSSLCTDRDVVISISNSGLTKEVLVPSRKAKQRGAKLIAICGTMKNKLCDLSDYRIIIPNNEPRILRLTSMFSRYGQFFVIDLLFIGVAKKLSANPEKLLERYKDILLELK
ncbi:MAG: MurR/RpiR family transcriptional regulator [Lachnospiraceae bacterium]|nr:MurR/RpiR family transcriptional regulator [Lachnospiraceae bacterium]